MNAHAYLTSQGWRGTGNSLHPTSNTIGLSRPLLVSKKKDTLGIGKKAHVTSDMWWMNAFDSSLKGLDTSKEGRVEQTVSSGGLDMVAKAGAKWVGSKGGLYASFVRGEGLSGTLTPETSREGSEDGVGVKRKRVDREEEKLARKLAKRAVEAAEDLSERRYMFAAGKSLAMEEQRAKKAAKKALREGRSKTTESTLAEESSNSRKTKEERKERKAVKKALREAEVKATESASTEDVVEATVKSESKEERKERKRLKRLAKELRDSFGTAKSEKE